MEYVVNIVFGIVGAILMVLPTYLWNRIVHGELVDYSVIMKRKRYKRCSVFGLLLFFAALFSAFEVGGGLETLWIVGYFFGSSRFFFDPYFESDISDKLEKQKFCLFLRPFNTDGKMNINPFFGFKSASVEWILCEELNKKLAQTFAIGNPGACLPSNKSVFNIYATDSEWHGIVHALSHKARLIVLRIGDTEGCKWEIENCNKEGFGGKMILLIENSNDLLVAKKTLGLTSSIEAVSKPYLAFYDEQSKQWVLEMASSKKEIKTFVSNYIQSHGNCCQSCKDTVSFRNIPAKFTTALLGYINFFALAFCNYWPLKWIIGGALYYLFALVFSVTLCLFSFDDKDLAVLLGIMLAFLVLFPFVMFASKISRNYHLWGCDVVYKRVNKELFWWLITLAVVQFSINMLQ